MKKLKKRIVAHWTSTVNDSPGALSFGIYLIAIGSVGYGQTSEHWWERIIWAIIAAFAFREATKVLIRAALQWPKSGKPGHKKES